MKVIPFIAPLWLIAPIQTGVMTRAQRAPWDRQERAVMREPSLLPQQGKNHRLMQQGDRARPFKFSKVPGNNNSYKQRGWSYLVQMPPGLPNQAQEKPVSRQGGIRRTWQKQFWKEAWKLVDTVVSSTKFDFWVRVPESVASLYNCHLSVCANSSLGPSASKPHTRHCCSRALYFLVSESSVSRQSLSSWCNEVLVVCHFCARELAASLAQGFRDCIGLCGYNPFIRICFCWWFRSYNEALDNMQ